MNIEKRTGPKERRQAEKQACMPEDFLRSLLDGFPDPIMVVDAELRPRLANQALKTFAGLEELPEDRPSCHQLIFGHEQTCEERGHACPVRQVLASGKAEIATHCQRLPSGEMRFLEITASPLMDQKGRLTGAIEMFRDVTEQKMNEELARRDHDEMERRVARRTADLLRVNEVLLKEVEERRLAEISLLQAKEEADLVYRVIPSVIFTVDLEQRITSWNNKAEEVTGYGREEVLGSKCEVFALRPCTTLCGVFSDKVKKPIMNRECEVRTKDGRILIVSKNADLLHDANGKVIGAIESFADITERKRVEVLLRTERDKLQSMLSALGQGMHILNRDFGIEYQNEVLINHFGDRIGEKCHLVYKQLAEPCEVCRMREAVRTGQIQRTELLMANGRYYEQSYAPFQDVDGEPKVLILLRDITEEKAFQAETMRAGQLAAIGELAAGVAHEINNPINGIINYAQILLDEQESGEESTEILPRIIREGERISGIVSNLLSFARQDGEDIEETSIERVVADSVALFQHQLLKDGIQLAVEIDQDLPPVWVNAQQLQQVFLNLLSNARYALNQRYPGKHPEKRLEIGSRMVTIEGKPFVRSRVTDYGTGIPPEIIDHIFKPFYSMKKPGEGTGLGLSISHGLIKDVNGYLWVDSKVNRFTTMTVDLPAAGGGGPKERMRNWT